MIGPVIKRAALFAACCPQARFSPIRAALDSCAAGLPAEAKAIYDAAAPEFAGAADPRALVKAKVTDLVKAGAVWRSSARSSTLAAGGRLKQLR